MNTNQTTDAGVLDDFDQCCESGYYRRHLATTAARGSGTGSAIPPTTSYETVRPAYAYGHRAATNPTYAGRTFEEVETELRRDYPEQSDFDSARDYVRQGFEWKQVLGALAVAAGGWWAGRKIYDAVSEMNEEDETDVRTYYASHPARSTGLPYERARTGYTLGYAASANPDYAGRRYDEVETNLQSGFAGAGGYDSVRDFARRGYERGTARRGGAPGLGTVS